MEQLNLKVPEAKPANTSWTITTIQMYWDIKVFHVRLRDSNGAETVFEYNGDAATKVLNDLNNPKETGSLQKRVFLKLAADGFLTGTVAGTPD